jgi:hypothetical protein
MTITEYINKLHEWAKDIGPEDEVEISPIRLISVIDPNLSTALYTILYSGKINDNN